MSAAMVDSFDTHMQDYSSDVMQDWLPADETMDGLSFHYDTNSVEVEMDFDGGEDGKATEEYEMADAEHPSSEYQPMEADVEDVQVFDVMTPAEAATTANDASHVDHDAMVDHNQPSFSETAAQPSVVEPQVETSTKPVVDESPPHPPEALPLTKALEEEQQTEIQSTETVEALAETTVQDASQPTEEELQASYSTPETRPVETAVEEEPIYEAPVELELNDQQNVDSYDATGEQDNLSSELVQNSTIEEPSADNVEELGTNEVDTTVPADSYGNAESAPCIFLSIFPSDTTQFYLFSQPSTALPGPSSITTDMQPHSLAVLLDEMPWLFTRGLGDLFAALRGEDCILESLNLETNELVLDARDLRLSFSENLERLDEVSLRDLNDLHDFNGLSGPLRLQIQAAPNFLSRFLQMKGKMNELRLGSPKKELVTLSVDLANADEGNDDQQQDEYSAQPHQEERDEAEQQEISDPLAEVTETSFPAVGYLAEDEPGEHEYTQVSEETSGDPGLSYEYTNEQEFEEEALDHDTSEASNAQGADDEQATFAEEQEIEESTRAGPPTEEASEPAGNIDEYEQEELKSFEDILNDDSAEDEDDLVSFGIDSVNPLGPSPADKLDSAAVPTASPITTITPNKEETLQELDDDLDAFDTTFELETATISNASSSTLESRFSSKRSFDDALDDTDDLDFLNESPSSKRHCGE